MDITAEPLKTVIRQAKEARDNAYAPYSKFKMGAALVTESGEIVKGSLIENISLGLAMCSERVALFSAVSANAGKPTALVLHAPKTAKKLTWPCGACLQVACELAGEDLLVIATNGVDTETMRLGDLATRLPIKPRV